ncbi:class I SAM-dependent methyltransferase [Congregibacter litoralis]|uniref:Putative methyltransferase n=1 Tax=Congregibacter litoralis KT71 TaxID=314285 RepID=A4A505_9GAMM|nr:class I SAM-dependent methyltransferase [Congregibacter litoralis]EAQ98876.1 putative methyltransferase [Congregibacter litoralis KT71]
MSFSHRHPLYAALLAAGFALSLGACQSDEATVAGSDATADAGIATAAGDAADNAAASAANAAEIAAENAAAASTAAAQDSLTAVLAAQPAEAQARYDARHPAETLNFFGIEPGMTVIEALPGGGWYSKILAPYLGAEGTLIGVDYDPALFPLFGFFSEEQLKAKETWVDDWLAEARGWFDAPVADLDAFQFGSLPERLDGEVDAVLFIRALHNLAHFESDGEFLTTSLENTRDALKPGGIVGVVQHSAPEDAPDAWADGSAGYLKKSFVINRFEAAGFEFLGESDINENPRDMPSTDDVVWRLPPTLSGSNDDPELAAAMTAIGESNRMTLLFKKPE